MRGDEWVEGAAEGEERGGPGANKPTQVGEAQLAVSQRERREQREERQVQRREKVSFSLVQKKVEKKRAETAAGCSRWLSLLQCSFFMSFLAASDRHR